MVAQLAGMRDAVIEHLVQFDLFVDDVSISTSLRHGIPPARFYTITEIMDNFGLFLGVFYN